MSPDVAIGFIQTFRRPPSRSMSMPPWERQIADWFYSQRPLSQRLRVVLGEYVPDWEIGLSRTFIARSEAIADVKHETERWPSQASYDPDIRHSGNVLAQLRGRFNQREWTRTMRALSPEQVTFLNAIAPGWQVLTDYEAIFRANVQKLKGWIADNDGRMPRQSPTATSLERAFARRVSRWRSYLLRGDSGRNVALSEARKTYLNEHIPGWDAGYNPQPRTLNLRSKQWENSLEMVARFVKTHHFFPSRRSFNPTEARLGWWVYEQRNAREKGRHTMSPERESVLNERLCGWQFYMLRGDLRRPTVSTDVGIRFTSDSDIWVPVTT